MEQRKERTAQGANGARSEETMRLAKTSEYCFQQLSFLTTPSQGLQR